MPRLLPLLAALLTAAQSAMAAPAPAVRTFPFRNVGGTILVPVRVAGAAPGWFILDTGANSCVLNKAYAAQIGVKATGAGQGMGAGRGPVAHDTYAPDLRFEIAGTPFRCPHFVGIDLSSQPAFLGEGVAGIIGTDLFDQFVVETDYELEVVRLHDPKAFAYAGGGARLPFTLDRRLPQITAQLTAGGATADRKLLVDSGSQSAIDDEWVMRAVTTREAEGGVGNGQSYRTKFGRLEEARLGPFRFTDVPGVGEGVPLIGSEILSRFTVIYDWPRKELVLEPLAYSGPSVTAAQADGLSLRKADDGAIKVWDVGAGTPAAAAGLQKGDVLARIDGWPTSAFGLPRLRRLFKPGRAYTVELVRSGSPRTVVLTL